MSAVTYMNMNDECDLVPFIASLMAPVVVSCNCTQGLYSVAHLTACAVALYLPTWVELSLLQIHAQTKVTS